LHNVLPRVFEGVAATTGDIWRREVTFERGKRYLVSAESGTGKSSLCSFLYGYRSDYSGDITFDGEALASFNVQRWCDIRTSHIAYLPQEMRLFDELTARENVTLKNDLTHHLTAAEIAHLFEAMGIADRADAPAGKLSIGQQQRVALIRTLCQPCDFFLLDEPVSHLDDANNAAVAALVSEEASRQGAGVIVTSVGNDLQLTYDQIYHL